MPNIDQVVLWPSEENYPRFRAVCDDELPEDYAGFLANAREQIAAHGLDEAAITKIDFDPGELARWCRERSYGVNSASRALYAAVRATEGE